MRFSNKQKTLFGGITLLSENEGVFAGVGGLARMVEETEHSGGFKFEGKMYLDGRLVSIDHGASRKQVEDAQRIYAEYRGWL
jgi:hypothetical protein